MCAKFREISLRRREKDTLLFLVKHDNRYELTLGVRLEQERNALLLDYSVLFIFRVCSMPVLSSLYHVFCLFLVIYTFLALLDYISRARKIEIRPSSVRVAIISVPYVEIYFKF